MKTNNRCLKGINLGGWLVAERWITPGLFDGVTSEGELAIWRELGYESASRRINSHREAFIQERDIRWLKTHGYDFFRLPVGYWSFDEVEDDIDGENFIDMAFDWAKKYDLGVVLDFHGLHGSQNGQDHSGQIGKIRFYWPWNMRKSLRTLEYISAKYGYHPSLVGLEIINEPKIPIFSSLLMYYYKKAYKIVARNTASHVKVIVSDGFQPQKIARKLSKWKGRDRLLLDVHLYQVFSDHDKLLTYDEHISKVKKEWSKLLEELTQYAPVLVGEWSGALPEQAFQSAGMSRKKAVKGYYEAQKEVFDKYSWGESYWTYSAPTAGAWGLRQSLDQLR